MCEAVLPNSVTGRSCADARTIANWDDRTALARLRAAGYP
jgi:hypothetical protein